MSVADQQPPEPASGDGRLTVEDQRFAIVPEWLIDTPLSDCAFRLYAVLLRYGQTSGQRMPSRATLARRLHKRSVDTVDRAMKELVECGAVVVERRRDGRQNLTNRYHVRTSGGSRTSSATPSATTADAPGLAAGGPARSPTPGRTGAATPAASVRPDPDSLTQTTPPPLQQLAGACARLRRDLGLPGARWSAVCLGLALDRAVARGWPAEVAERALLAVAADPASRSPMRLAEAGPWWDLTQAPAAEPQPRDLGQLEEVLDALDGRRALLQRQARQELSEEGQPLTRSTVVRRAVEIHRREAQPEGERQPA